jgi:2-amino-4-hydroxy-6-hydroxymethyldihydropteridine diphosphokinase
MTAVRSYLALGSNLGDRQAMLALARRRIGALPGTALLAASRVEETVPLGGLDQPAYLNQMLAVETGLPPEALWAACQDIEAEAGRVPAARWASRTLDIDIVAYGALRGRTGPLELPHPGLADREFWQRELAELHEAGW